MGALSSLLACGSRFLYTMVMQPVILTIFFSSFILALSGALMPGPLLSVSIAESARRGILAGPLMILGHGLLELAVVFALFSGLAPLLLRDDVFILISFVGGTILLWMAFSMIRALPDLRLQLQEEGKKQRNLITAGIVLSAANPYFIIWWASIGFGYILYSAKFGLLGIVSFFLGHILADLLWYSSVSWSVWKGRHILTDSGYRYICVGCALFLITFSIYFFYSGIDKMS